MWRLVIGMVMLELMLMGVGVGTPCIFRFDQHVVISRYLLRLTCYTISFGMGPVSQSSPFLYLVLITAGIYYFVQHYSGHVMLSRIFYKPSIRTISGSRSNVVPSQQCQLCAHVTLLRSREVAAKRFNILHATLLKSMPVDPISMAGSMRQRR